MLMDDMMWARGRDAMMRGSAAGITFPHLFQIFIEGLAADGARQLCPQPAVLLLSAVLNSSANMRAGRGAPVM